MTDNLSQRFAALDADVSRQALIVAADRVRARGDRRRINAVATSAIVLGVFATLGAVGVNLFGGERGGVVGNPRSPLEIPADFRLPHEGEAGWQSGDTVTIPPGVFGGCGTSDPTLAGRTDRRVALGPGFPGEESHSPTRVTEQLILFDSDRAANSALVALVADYRACGWLDPGMGLQLDSQLVTGEHPNARVERIVGYQVGNALFLVTTTTTGALMSSAGTTELGIIEAQLCAKLNLCRPHPVNPTHAGGSTATPTSPTPSGSGQPAGPSGPPGSPPTVVVSAHDFLTR